MRLFGPSIGDQALDQLLPVSGPLTRVVRERDDGQRIFLVRSDRTRMRRGLARRVLVAGAEKDAEEGKHDEESHYPHRRRESRERK
jgi:hypothetical protein